MKDYRLPENRREFFDRLYAFNLNHRVMPGLVYLYFPELKRHFNWGADQALWFAFLNGMTQNPLTSLRIYSAFPYPELNIIDFEEWFNQEWCRLQFDTDRRHQKRDTIKAVDTYTRVLIKNYGSQENMLTGKTYPELWKIVREEYYSFGRLSAFSYLEYVRIMGYGADCTDLMFDDVSGSRSHRNGMLLLTGRDDLVCDKRMQNGFDGRYEDFAGLCKACREAADLVLSTTSPHPDAGYFTLESNLCTFKNHFFGRRYPGVYADMAHDRLKWYEKMNGPDEHTALLWGIRESLPEWLRNEGKLTLKQKAEIFPKTGFPYRGEYLE